MNSKLTPLAFGFTIFDAIATYIWLTMNIAEEANPWLACLVEGYGPFIAMFIRGLLGVILVAVLDSLIAYSTLAKKGLVLVTVALGLVCLWHIGGYILYGL